MDLFIRLVMLFIIFRLLMLCVRLTLPFPRYFGNGTMRIVPGEKNNEYWVETINVIDGVESWVRVTTLYGLTNALAYVAEQDKKARIIKKIWRRWRR